jgi:pSer/pThr/pTyr-binding forkhead associated (FHA) protein
MSEEVGMCACYGKLVLLNPNGPCQEYILEKSKVTLGRMTTNDIMLNDVRVSRSHARLDCGESGITLVDLGSSNGTRLNGIHIDRATLKPEDTIGIGSLQLKYKIEDPSEDVGITKIDTESQLDQTINQEFLPVIINETGNPNLVVFTGKNTWQVDLGHVDQVTIGRDESCSIVIESSNVSRRHAEVYRQEGMFILSDSGSTNGTWVEGEKVDQYALQDGDNFQIGPAHIMFKAGFQEQSLTMADEKLAEKTGRRVVIFVPGLMGSELWLGNERVWPNVKTIFSNPEIYKYPSDVPLEPRNIVDEVVIIPNFIKQDQYNRMGDYLVEELNYKRGVDYFEFAYDWRQDIRTSAQQLAELINSISASKPLILIGHSLGALVSRYYVDHLGGSGRVERLILMGGPHKGAVKGLVSMLVAPDVLPFGLLGERLREILMTFPTSYQILPAYDVGTDQDGNKINFLEDDRWLASKYHPLLKLGRDYHMELAKTASISSVSIFGYGLKTISDVNVRRDDMGKLLNVDYIQNNNGDGSVLEQSAFLPGSDIHPVRQNHCSLFVDNDVRMRLKLELTRSFQ